MQKTRWNYQDIEYKQHKIQFLNLLNCCAFDVIGNYTNSELNHIDGFIEQLETNKFRMSITTTDDKSILLLDNRDVYKSFEDCINFLKHCIDVFLYN